jgi:hypothetical protein
MSIQNERPGQRQFDRAIRVALHNVEQSPSDEAVGALRLAAAPMLDQHRGIPPPSTRAWVQRLEHNRTTA